MEMEKSYNPKSFEERIYKEWEEKKYFHAKVDKKKKPYTIMMPPPNITGQLHMGHALNQSIQDTIIRFKRMQGYSALWLPGTDHASIATEVKIVEQMKKEGIDKADLTREEFLERAWKWKEKFGGRIVEQLKRLGSSCDWDRLAFTMDEKCSKAVREVFVKLYKKGDIFKGKRIINWCPTCKTALSDAEVEYETEDSFFWHIRYQIVGTDDYIIVATTRPETMFGDTAIAVNPNDDRYKHLQGKKVILPIINKEIPIVFDDYVDMEFGTGAVKITPAHDPNDFEVGLRHNLPVIRVMNDNGTMNENAGSFVGLDRMVCREKTVEELKKLGNLVKIEPHTHNTQHCYRCHHTVEPIVSEQWFVKMKDIAEPAIKAVREGDIKFIPKRFDKIYFNWMENIKDWCISRQLWWGHRIPAFYCKDCGNLMVEIDDVKVCTKCKSTNVVQDEDVLDTWFSSALWPFSTLGYPDKTEDLDFFYPTNVLITAYDIIFFWVARMIFSGIEHMKEIPFDKVLIHGIVRDAQGRKMSKSLGNGIDPIEIIDKYGADTLRFSLLNGISAGGDTRFSDDKVEGNRNFMNKIWNASRFVLMNIEGKELKDIDAKKLTIADKWILTRLNQVAKEVTNNLDKFELGLAGNKLYDFVWSEFCDWYIELIKPVLYGDDEDSRNNTLSVLKYVLEEILKLLHPFIPFITEEIYSFMHDKTIMLESYPKYNKKFVFEEASNEMQMIMDVIKGIRNLKNEMNVVPSKRTKLYVLTSDYDNIIKSSTLYLQKLAYLNDITIVKDKNFTEKVTTIMVGQVEMYIPLGDLVDSDKEKERLMGELKKVESEIKRANGKLNNQGFVAKAPQTLIDAEKQKLTDYQELKVKLEAKIKELD